MDLRQVYMGTLGRREPTPSPLIMPDKNEAEIGLVIPIAVDVGTTSTEVLRPNSRRKKLVLINDSDTVVYVCYGTTAVLNSGKRLNAEGGAWVDEPDNLGYIWKGPVTAISSAATKRLCGEESS